ncbi:MAG: acyl-CoA thioesterase [Bacteroidia bacterium]
MTTQTKLQIRFNDIDLAGHVHNGVYLSYFEQGRLDFFKHLATRGWDWRKYGLILARNEVDYLTPIKLHDNIVVHVSSEEVGTKSFTLSYQIKSEDGNVIYTKGKSVMVCFDYLQNASVEVYSEWKEKLMSREK